jgi:asparagine synthase (glutamine-hydrolysing)
LKKLSQDILPPQIIDREKFGFTAPGSAYLLQQHDEYINDMLSIDNIRKQGYFNPQVIAELKTRYMQPGFKLNAPSLDLSLCFASVSSFVFCN